MRRVKSPLDSLKVWIRLALRNDSARRDSDN